MIRISLIFIVFALIIFSCEPDKILTDTSVNLKFSSDTISFDTVFTAIGSATKRLKIYNNYNQPIVVSSVKVARGTNSYFRINADGRNGFEINNIRIEANDSAYLFVQVLVDFKSPTPFIDDSLIFAINNNFQKVKLTAYGQDIHLIHDSVINTQTWIADKPYVVDSMLIDSNAVLTIQEGVKIYIRRKGFIWVDGKLIVNGTKDNHVVFRGTRLDKSNYSPSVSYDIIPGQWNQIRFSNKSSGNKINYADIRNAEIGIVAGELNEDGQAEVELSNCKIYNHSSAAIFAIKSKIKAWNCILANCGYSAFMCVQGGEYEFYHCTLAAYRIFGKEAGLAAVIMNYAQEPDYTSSDPNAKIYYYGDLKKAYFGNCILFGELDDEVILNGSANYAFEYTFDHSLLKGTNKKLNIADETRFIKAKISNKYEPGFSKVDKFKYEYNFELTRTSLAREAGDITIANMFPKDYNGNSRTADESPDAGAFEYVIGNNN